MLNSVPGKTSLIAHTIATGTSKLIRLPPYRLPHAYWYKVKTELEEMLAAGIIERSTSEWSFPIVIVKKKDGSL